MNISSVPATQQYWIQVPLISAADMCEPVIEGVDTDMNGEKFEDTWSWWGICFSCLFNYSV